VKDSPGATTSRSHRSDAPADSITPMACHVDGAAWQNVCTRENGSGAYDDIGANTTPEVSMTIHALPGSITPTPRAPAA
jgi:hypothetical protein